MKAGGVCSQVEPQGKSPHNCIGAILSLVFLGTLPEETALAGVPRVETDGVGVAAEEETEGTQLAAQAAILLHARSDAIVPPKQTKTWLGAGLGFIAKRDGTWRNSAQKTRWRRCLGSRRPKSWWYCRASKWPRQSRNLLTTSSYGLTAMPGMWQ